MCKEKATGEILAMKIHKKDLVVAQENITYTLTEKRVLHNLERNPFLLVCHPLGAIATYIFSLPVCLFVCVCVYLSVCVCVCRV